MFCKKCGQPIGGRTILRESVVCFPCKAQRHRDYYAWRCRDCKKKVPVKYWTRCQDCDKKKERQRKREQTRKQKAKRRERRRRQNQQELYDLEQCERWRKKRLRTVIGEVKQLQREKYGMDFEKNNQVHPGPRA